MVVCVYEELLVGTVICGTLLRFTIGELLVGFSPYLSNNESEKQELFH